MKISRRDFGGWRETAHFPMSTGKPMTKRDLQILERIFTAEIENRLPFQSRSKQIQRLVEEGYVEPMTRSFGRDRLGEMIATGYALTHAGRITYCESCKDAEL